MMIVIFLNVNFLISKIGITIVSTSQDLIEIMHTKYLRQCSINVSYSSPDYGMVPRLAEDNWLSFEDESQ